MNRRTMDASARDAGWTTWSATALGGVLALLALLAAAPAGAQTPSAVRFSVWGDDGSPIPRFKYLVNLDNTGTTRQRAPGPDCAPSNPAYPGTCEWVSIAGVPGSSPVMAQGTDADAGVSGQGVPLPAGRYLVSILADGWKLGGVHFTLEATGSLPVDVVLHSTEVPDATIQAAVFEDVSPVNGAPDVPAERGLAGFQGHIADYLGEVTTDVYGQPLCTEYAVDPTTHLPIRDPITGDLIPVPGGLGICLSKCYVVSGGVDLGTVATTDGVHCPVDATGLATTLEGTAIPAGAAVEGKLKIPHLGPNRYALSITPPDGSGWVQTTTLEGNLDWDAWIMEGATGLDTEFVVAGEPFPAIIFGYTPGGLNRLAAGGTATIKGVVEKVNVYVPTTGGVSLPGTIWGGMTGAKVVRPIARPWVALTDLSNGDSAVWIGRGNVDGSFSIPAVPAGTYTLTWWDERLDNILDLVSVTVGQGETLDLGILPLTGWWTEFEGYVFEDANRNGVKDPGERGIPNFTLTMRKRENSLMDRGATAVTTDAAGHYYMENAYPMTQWLVMEAYSDSFYTTGVTFQADNQPAPTTILGAGVDVSVHPVIGLGGRLDWGVHAYDATGQSCTPKFSYTNCVDPRNGGIVGTVSYDTTRNELDARFAFVEDWQPGVSGLTVELFEPVACGVHPDAPCDTYFGQGNYELAPDGSYLKGQRLNTYVTETWERPGKNHDGVCIPRDVDGVPLAYPARQQVTGRFGDTPAQDGDCLEAPLMGVQFQAGFSAVDGNYGFADGCFAPSRLDTSGPTPICRSTTAFDIDPLGNPVEFAPLPGGRDYLVEVQIPNDARGMPLYRVTREEDINIANGDVFVPQVPPPACAGPLHTVDVVAVAPSTGTPPGKYAAAPFPPGCVAGDPYNPCLLTVPASTSTVNATFVGIGASPYEGQPMPQCGTKLVPLANGKSVVPTFNLYTDVPLPTRFWGLIVDDLNFSANPRSIDYGEKAGVPFAPVGIYDFTNRLVTTVESDYNGLWDVLLPSTNRISCPTPSGVCANVYRMVGNDPGVAGRLNPNYHPEFRTIAAEFEALPGLLVPADLAPTQVGVTVQLPGGQTTPVSCALDPAQPQLFAVSQPYGRAGATVTVTGLGFGPQAGGSVRLDGTSLAVSGWSDRQVTFAVTAASGAAIPTGPHQLSIVAANGQATVNGLTFHVTGTGYNPTVLEVGPSRPYAPANTLPAAADHAIQRALDAAPAGALVVVYPNAPTLDTRVNPRGAYYENLIVTKRVKLQGVGPGGVYPDGTPVGGSIIDGSAFAGDSPVALDWYTRLLAATWAGNQTIFDGAVISLFLPSSGGNAFPTAFSAATAPAIDGFDLRGGDQQGFPGNLNAIGGAPTGLPANLVTQGGAIFANAFARNLQITNNVVQNNGGAYGTVRIGTPDLPAPDTDSQNDGVRILHNRIIANAGTNLAGGIGLFAGAAGFEVAHNDLCGNFSAEYGGGLTVYGRHDPSSAATTASIHHNRIYFNRSYDEGGGIMIAGQLPADPATLSPGAGPVDVYANRIQANLANDDGGGIRFLQAGNFPMNVFNNFIVNNVSTHEGGGVSLNDAPAVRFFNNTVMKNLTTATAVTSTGAPAPAGLSTSQTSAPLQATLPPGSPTFSEPLLFNNVFWDNRAGTRVGAAVSGIGLGGTADVDAWDMGVADPLTSLDLLRPTNSILQSTSSIVPDPTNGLTDPGILLPWDVSVSLAVWRTNPAFAGAILVALDLPPNLMGDYHLATGSPAVALGAAFKGGVNAPAVDIDGQGRPPGYDAGADELAGSVSGANLAIALTDDRTSVAVGDRITYVISVTNDGPTPGAATATVIDTMPATLTNVVWGCAATGGATCGGGAFPRNLSRAVTVPVGGRVTFTAQATVAPSAAGTLSNTAVVAPTGATNDPDLGNNSATDTDLVTAPARPVLALLDTFNRASATRLGASSSGPTWTQSPGTGAAALRILDLTPGNTSTGVASGNSAGAAYWPITFGASQGASVTLGGGTTAGVAVILKAGTSILGVPLTSIRVSVNATSVVIVPQLLNVALTGSSTTLLGPDTAFAAGDTLTATTDAAGTVRVWKNATYLGAGQLPTTAAWTTGSGRIGLQLPAGARGDNFSGGVAP